MEAEFFDVSSESSSHSWIPAVLGNSSNDDAMITTPNEGQLAVTANDVPMLGYLVSFRHSGQHFLWVRGLGDTDESGMGNDDSIQVGLNGSLADTAANVNTFPNEWTWSRTTASGPVATLNVVDAGVNMINFWMREDGFAFDKFVITNDPDFVPTGFGPQATDGTVIFFSPNDDSETDAVFADETTGDADDELALNQLGAESGLDNGRSGGDSGGGFFGGTSLAALLSLFGLTLVRFGQIRATRTRV